MLVNSLDIVRQHSILHMNVILALMSIHIFNQLVHVFKGNKSILESEIGSPNNQQVVTIIMPNSSLLTSFNTLVSL